MRDIVCLNLQSTFFVFLGIAFSPLQEAVGLTLGLSDNAVGLIQGPIVNSAVIAFGILLGLLADRYPRAALLRIYFVLALGASIATALAADFAVVAAARAMSALTVTASWIASLSLLADLYPPERRGRGFTIFAIVGALPAASAFAVGGWLLNLVGPDGEAWRKALLVMTALATPIGLLSFLIREPPRGGRPASSEHVDLKRLAGLKPFLGVLAILVTARAALMIADGAAIVWAAPMYAREHGLDPSRIASIMAPALLCAGLLGVFLNWAATDAPYRRGGAQQVVLLAGLAGLLSVPFAAFPAFQSLYLSGLSLFAFLTLGNMIGLMSVVMATLVLPSDMRGISLGVIQTGGYLLGAVPAPLAVSFLSTHWGGREYLGEALTTVCVAASLACGVTLLLGAYGFKRGKLPADAGA